MRINSINFSKERPETDEGNIQSLLGQLRGFITYFMFTVRILAINYQQCKLERRKPNEDEFTLEEAIRTVLSEFKLTNAQINYLTSQILVSSHKYKGDIQSTDFDVSFYEKGFRYFAFEDSYAHDTQSKIMMYSFQLTPEKLLLRFCEKAKVLGISATATLPSAIGNYDMEYVAEKLQHKYVEPNNTEKARLKDELAQSVKGYDKVNIHAELIGTSSYSVEAWKEVVDNEEVAQYLFDHVAANCQQDYDKERYLRIAIVFKRFLLEERIQSFLCILTKHPRKNDRTLNLDVLCFIFDCISKLYRAAFDVQKNVVQLDGDEYDSKKNEIIGRLGKGDRLFVISVYQTIGAGQNLQYPVPKGRMQDLVVTNDRPNRGEKDFDAIYLDKLTSNLSPIST